MKLRAASVLMLCSGIAGAQEGPNHAQLRWEWFYRQRAYPFAQIAPGALDNARMQLGSLRASLRILGAPPIGGSRWQSIGPFSINGTAIGRISAVAVHPTNANIVYIGGAQGGVWKTTDGGSTWTPLTDKQCSLAMGSIVLDPVNPEIIYAGTGEQHFSGDSYYGCGVLRSTDGGASWTQLAPLALRVRISRIVVLPSTAGSVATTTILAATDDGLFRSTNGGTTWTTVRAGVHTDLVFDPSNDLILYTGFRNNGGTGGVFKSIDGGATWLAAGTGLPTSGLGRINIGIAPSSPATLYAALASLTNSEGLRGLFKSIDGGNSWTQLPATNASCGSQCWYDLHVTVSPANPNTVFFGGISLFRSTDGGQTFANVGGVMHVDQHFMAFDPQNPQRVYAANDGGIYRSDNGGTVWAGINNGLAITQFYGGISLHPTNSSLVIGGTQDNGTLSYTGAPTWIAIIGGDGGFTAINPENASIQYGETQWTPDAQNPLNNPGGPRRSDGGGFTKKANGINLSDPGLFIPPLVMDPSDARVLYFGTNKVSRTIDGAENWTAFSPVLGSGVVGAIAPAPSNPAVVYVAYTGTPRLHATFDGGNSWSAVSNGLPARTVTDIAVDRADPQTAYATISGFGTGHVYRTVNGGQTWTNVSGTLPDMPVNAVSLDPATRGFVMIGTDLGVFTSSDSGSTWTVLDDGMPNVAVFDIAYNSATGALIAATHGRGMFQLQLDRGLTLATVPGKRRINFPENSSTVRTDSAAVVLSGTGAGNAQWVATHTAAASWLTLTTASGTGNGMVRWTVNPSGRAPGFYVDTISVTSPGAIDSPARVIDTLFIESSGLILSPAHRDTLVSGSTVTKSSSVQLTIPGNGPLNWTVTHGSAAWLTITTQSGSGPGTISWTKTAANLRDGVFIDTITVSAPGTLPARVIDTLTVIAPVTNRTCVVNHLLGAPCLDATQLKWLDLAGNRDGTYNLGDLLSYLARPASAPPTPQRRRDP